MRKSSYKKKKFFDKYQEIFIKFEMTFVYV